MSKCKEPAAQVYTSKAGTAYSRCMRHMQGHASHISTHGTALRQQRSINIDQHGAAAEELSEKDFHRFSDLTLGELLAKLEALIEETPDLADSDLEYGQASQNCKEVFALSFGSG